MESNMVDGADADVIEKAGEKVIGTADAIASAVVSEMCKAGMPLDCVGRILLGVAHRCLVEADGPHGAARVLRELADATPKGN